MTTLFYKTGAYNRSHSSFGGEIDLDDFSTNSPNKKRINNQADAVNLQNTLEREKK